MYWKSIYSTQHEKTWENIEQSVIFQAAMFRLGKYGMDGRNAIGVYRVNDLMTGPLQSGSVR